MSLEHRLFQLLVLLLPTQLTFHYFPSWSYVFGLKIDYLAVSLYFTDLLIISLLVVSFITKKPKRPNFDIFARLSFVFVATNILFSSSIAITTIAWLKMAPDFSLAYYVYENSSKVKDHIVKPLTLSLIFLSTLAILQFIHKGSLGGLLYWLGERDLSVFTPGIAKFNFGGINYLRPYATFPHPNALAGFIGASALLIGKPLFLIGLLPTLSRNAISALLGVFLLRGKFSKATIFIVAIFSLVLPLKGPLGISSAIDRRLQLATWAGEIVSVNPVNGTGLGTYIYEIGKLNNTSQLRVETLNSLLQPVHNIYLLVLSETGLLGLCIIVILLTSSAAKTKDSKVKNALLFIVLSGTLDHYWLTIKQTRLLFFVILALARGKDKR